MGKTFVWKEKKDKICKCIRCGSEYVFTVGEQDYFDKRGFQHPKRCKACRQIHKNEMEILNLNGRGKYYGLGYMTPGLYKGRFKGGIDVTDISGKKYKCKAYFGY